MNKKSGSAVCRLVAPGMIREALHRAATCFLVSAGLHADSSAAADHGPPRWMPSAYAAAVSSFRQARFPEAYGRFVALAAWNHAPAARHALWMCEHGQELFGRPFDCAPDEIESWAIQSGIDPRDALRRIYPSLVGDAGSTRVRR